MHQIIAPTINYDTPDPEYNLDYVPNIARDSKVNALLSNTFGLADITRLSAKGLKLL